MEQFPGAQFYGKCTLRVHKIFISNTAYTFCALSLLCVPLCGILTPAACEDLAAAQGDML